MERIKIVNTIGIDSHTFNIEGGEYSYCDAAGGLKKLEEKLGFKPSHYKLDIRFHKDGVSVLVETKKKFVKDDELQLSEYVKEERALFPENKIVAILANTTANNDIKVWKNEITDSCYLKDEVVLDTIDHYIKIFKIEKKQ